jgi:UDP-N-acetylmuramoyl-tripeptide--D-alanyl-D-alanine ligase
MEMTNKEILEAVGGTLIAAGPLHSRVGRVFIDSREMAAGGFFVPLPGERTDGHRFILRAAEKGAVGSFAAHSAVVPLPPGLTLIGVDDPLAALQQLAAVYRQKFTLPVVGVTGSVGKTTTKDMIAAALSTRLNTLKTEGNLNNHIGVPLMLTRLDASCQAAVLEMGMSGYGEIDLLARLARPDVAVITNIGESHLEMLGSREGIARAKCELLPHVPRAGTAVVNGDEPLLEPYLAELGCRVLTFGFSPGVALRCTAVEEKEGRKWARLEQDGYSPLTLSPPLPGRHNIYNVMAALAVGRTLGLTDEELTAGLATMRPSAMRLDILTTGGGFHVINDAYNASPTSMAAALDVLMEKAAGARRFAVLGDMLELGDLEEEGHRRIGRLAAKCGLDGLIVLGERAMLMAEGALEAGFAPEKIARPGSHAQAGEIIEQWCRPGDWVLVKGSRGMCMEKVLDGLLEGME